MKKESRILLVLFAGVLMGALDVGIVGPALPSLQRTFQVDERALAWTLNAYILFNLFGAPLLAKCSDLMGRRFIFVLAVSVFALGSLIVASAPDFGMLLGGRSLQGFAAGGMFPVAATVIGESFPPERRGSALGLLGAVYGIAFLVGPILGGVLLLWDWRLLFLINLPLAAWVVVMSFRHLGSLSAAPRRHRVFDGRGMLALGCILGCLAYGLQHLDTRHVPASLWSLHVGPFLAGAGLLLPVFWYLENGASDPILPVGLLSSWQAASANAVAGGAGVLQGMMVFTPAFLVRTFQVTSSTASFMLAPIVLALVIGAPLAGKLLDSLGSRIVVIAGSLLVTTGMILLGTEGSSLFWFYPAAFLLGLGLSSLAGAAPRYIMLNETPAEDRSAAQGSISLFSRIGMLLGTALAGVIIDSLGGTVAAYQTTYLVSGAVGVLLLFVALGLRAGRPQHLTGSTEPV